MTQFLILLALLSNVGMAVCLALTVKQYGLYLPPRPEVGDARKATATLALLFAVNIAALVSTVA